MGSMLLPILIGLLMNQLLQNLGAKPFMDTSYVQTRILKAVEDYGQDDDNVTIRFHGIANGWDVTIPAGLLFLNFDNVSDFLYSTLGAEDSSVVESRDYEYTNAGSDITKACLDGMYFNDKLFLRLVELINNNYDKEEVLLAGLKYGIPIDNILDAYIGTFDSLEEFGREFIACTGLDLSDNIRPYFDFELYGEDMSSEVSIEGNHYFWSNY